MKSWIENDVQGRDYGKRGDDRRIGGGGRISANDKKKSLSPNSKMRKQGEEFLSKIEMLKEDL